VTVEYAWRGEVENTELNTLHAEAFDTRVFDETEWDWVRLLREHSLGWVVARDGGELVGFVNVVWDGLVHAWLQDTMVAGGARHHGIGGGVVALAAPRPAWRAASGSTSTSTSTCDRSTSTRAGSRRRAPV
jgi:hypothetical protein